MKKCICSIGLTVFIFFFIGCTSVGPTAGYAESIEEAHPDRFAKTTIGMDVNEFKAVWPEATRAGFGNNEEKYEFVYTHLAMGGYAFTYKIFTYFYFTDNKLQKYESTKRTF